MRFAATILYRFRYPFLGLILVITVVFGTLIEMEMDNSLKAWFSGSDPDYVTYEDYRSTFEGGRFLIVALRSEDVFSLEVLHYIREKTGEFEDLPRVKRVHSLANANKVIGSPMGIEINPLLSDLRGNKLGEIREYTLDDELFRDYLISSDGTFTAIVLTFEDLSYTDTDRALRLVREIANRGKPEGLEVFLAGDMRIYSEFNRFTVQNQKVLPLFVIPLISICILLLFWSFSRLLIILLVIGISLCWALGFYSALGFNFNVVTGMLIPLVTILSIATSIHIIEYFEEMRRSYRKKEALVHTISYIAIPCFITSITTSFGLLSLCISHIDAVRHFSIGSAVGILFSFLISIILVPLLLTMLPLKHKREKPHLVEGLLRGISSFNERRFKAVLVMAVAGFAFFAVGITKVAIETNQIEWFPKDEECYRSAMLVDRNLSGIGDTEIVIKGRPGVLKEPQILRRIDTLSSKISGLPGVKKVISLADYVKRIHKALEGDDPAQYRIPDSRELVAQELFLFTLSDDGRQELERITTSDYSQGRISVKTRSMPSRQSVAMGRLLNDMAREALYGTETSVTLTGAIHLYNVMQEYLLESQIKGFSLAFLMVIGVLFIAFWSLKYGTLSIIPNLLPIVFILGIMGWSGIALNTGTVMIASVALGIAADDTIHFISRFRRELNSRAYSIADALRRTTLSVGNAIIFTSVINIAGFLLLFISDFQPTREFGALIALTLFFAFIGDIVLLPSVMLWIRKHSDARR
jgi:predicted RND superfamily exporter protein